MPVRRTLCPSRGLLAVTTMPSIRLKDVCVDLPIYNSQRAIAQIGRSSRMAVGGVCRTIAIEVVVVISASIT